MGFFDRKAICGVCSNEVGLNRYKVKKSDAWVCPGCVKQAGGFSVVNVNKVTVEEIKAIIDAKAEKRGDDPMNSAEGMYRYCVENKFGSGFNEKWGIKHFGILENNLIKGEKVLMTFIGLHNYVSVTKHDNNYAYAITNKRIMFGQKQTISGEKFKAIAYERINDISFETGMMFGVLTIDTPQEKFNIALDKGSAISINSHIHEVLDTVKNGSNGTQPQTASGTGSVADELKKFKELLDSGVVTEDEFNTKKKQLLGI
ncbi:PH domain-containing protein [Neobacillus sp. OS1-33]|uniref:PH domain-containing protein n=1 Tax=Neobacillus sp. OS1-33 TaxID=3070683 RepID=UPI0027E05163|nr:PH domain-containing protein [Neobacillus sp. OS1-33]WML26266.1 PH domain-containing protein [Neobacillus sp. OS1-33]